MKKNYFENYFKGVNMKKFMLFIFLTITINAQSWNAAVSLEISNASKIDNYANKDGIHILLKTSTNQIKYYLTDVTGATIRSYPFASSNGDFPNIVGSDDGTKLYATYKDGTNIKTQYSTNAGVSWSPLANIDLTDYPTLNAIDVVHYKGKTHITWATSEGGYKVHYKMYNSNNQLGDYKEVTDYGSEFGFHPSMTASGDYVYVSYNKGNNLSPGINVGDIKIRGKNTVTNQWDNPEEVPLIWPYHSYYEAQSRIERIYVTDNYLYLFYMGSVHESYPTELNVITKNMGFRSNYYSIRNRNGINISEGLQAS
jgi:hypothetical protein